MELYAAFTLGLFGSLHCVGMCGPLMLAATHKSKVTSMLVYQAGRIFTYVLLGALLGGLGLGMQLWNLQSWVAFVSGGILVLGAVFQLDIGNYFQKLPALGRFQIMLRNRMGRYLRKEGLNAQFSLGCCNGFLPCGLVYLAVIGAANTGSPLAGASFMASFGLGTIPLLFVTLIIGRKFFQLSPKRFKSLSTATLFVAGVMLLYRGWLTYVPNQFFFFQDVNFPTMCH